MRRNIAVMQLGIGRVGGALVPLIIRQAPRWRAGYKVDVGYFALADSTAIVTAESSASAAPARLSTDDLKRSVDARRAGESLASRPGAIPWTRWEAALHGALAAVGTADDLAVLDCTSGPATMPLLLAARAAGAHVVLANKDPLTGPLAQYRRLVDGDAGGSLRVSATVGAGLPVVATLAALMASGDTLLDLGARASGSLGFVCGALSEGIHFDEAMRQAQSVGYTEPDPRQDLSGFDVARKLLILARAAGIEAELADIRVESLVPPDAETLTLGDFQARLPTCAHHLAERFAAARTAGRMVRYVGRIDHDGTLSAALVELSADDPLAGGQGPDNVFRLRSARYDAHPITISGPGAGIEVTASAVASDLLRAVGVL